MIVSLLISAFISILQPPPPYAPNLFNSQVHAFVVVPIKSHCAASTRMVIV